jgi:TrmH family RNA methyltransferase
MLSAALKKYVKALQQKKIREQEQAFIVEGEKNVSELLLSNPTRLKHLFCTREYATSNPAFLQFNPIICRAEDLVQMGTFLTNNAALAVVKMPAPEEPNFNDLNGLILALDGVRDPGNLGTIIRLADWFGCHTIICSPDSVDVYNPKVINATMGSFLRVNVYYAPLTDFLKNTKLPCISAELGGTSMYQFNFPESGILILGNESKGVSAEVSALAQFKVAIPRYGGAESLNVGMAAAVLLSSWRGQL